MTKAFQDGTIFSTNMFLTELLSIMHYTFTNSNY